MDLIIFWIYAVILAIAAFVPVPISFIIGQFSDNSSQLALYPIFWFLSLFGLGIIPLVIIQALIAYFSSDKLRSRPLIARTLLGGIVTLPLSLVIGVYIPIAVFINETMQKWMLLAIMYTLHIIVACLIIFGGYWIGKIFFPTPESLLDKNNYKKKAVLLFGIAILITILQYILTAYVVKPFGGIS